VEVVVATVVAVEVSRVVEVVEVVTVVEVAGARVVVVVSGAVVVGLVVVTTADVAAAGPDGGASMVPTGIVGTSAWPADRGGPTRRAAEAMPTMRIVRARRMDSAM
jgi:hypothetical protein